RFLARRVFGPLAMPSTRFLPPAAWRDRIAPTENDTMFRHRLLVGEVHDESAARLGGVSGNAGLFSNALDLSRFAAMLLNGGAWDTLQLIRAETVAEFTTRQNLPPGSTRALGWDTPSDSGYSSAGAKLSRRSFGHTGYTGTSLWMDPDRDLFIILLTNRVHPTRENTAILRVRAHVADLVADALGRRTHVGSEGGYRPPARPRGPRAAVERDQGRVRLGAREERDRKPYHRCDRDRNEHDVCEVEGLVALEPAYGLQQDRHDERGDHRGDFAPRIDPPPVPAQQQHGARPSTGDDQHPPRPADRFDAKGHRR